MKNLALKKTLAAAALFAAAAAGAADLYVSTNDVHVVEGLEGGWGTYVTDDGVSHDAYTNLQQAVDAAAKGDTVWVENGFVCDEGATNPKIKDSSFNFRIVITNSITLRGRSGTWQNGPVVRGRWHCDADATSASATGAEAVGGIRASGSTIIGFRIVRCSNDGSWSGGVAVQGASEVRNCFIGDVKVSYNTVGGPLRNCVVSNCYASTYGGLLAKGASAYDTLFVNNRNANLNITQGAIVSNCTFVGNSDTTLVWFGGGTKKTIGRLLSCVFTNNTASGFAFDYGANNFGFMSNCVFAANRPGKIGWLPYRLSNGAPDRNNNLLTAVDCKFVGNTTSGAFLEMTGEFVNCLIASNTTTSVATPLVNAVDPTATLSFYNSTIVDNVTTASKSAARGLVATGGVYAVNSILSGNPDAGDAVLLGATNCCLTAASERVTPGKDNVGADDPLLVKGGEKMYRPRGASPCRGKGSLDAYALPARDLSGRPRLTNDKVSIGCYEPYDDGFLLIVR